MTRKSGWQISLNTNITRSYHKTRKSSEGRLILNYKIQEKEEEEESRLDRDDN